MTYTEIIKSFRKDIDLIDLINRQQAEIERLQKEVNLVSIQFQDLQERYEEAQTEIERLEEESSDKERAYTDEYCLRKEWQDKCRQLLIEKQTAKSEAIKEFAERLKEHSRKMQSSDFSGDFWDAAVLVEDINNIAKEMVGDNNESV